MRITSDIVQKLIRFRDVKSRKAELYEQINLATGELNDIAAEVLPILSPERRCGDDSHLVLNDKNETYLITFAADWYDSPHASQHRDLVVEVVEVLMPLHHDGNFPF